MKIRTVPQEYDAIIFNGINQEIDNFIDGRAKIHKHGDDFILSDPLGNHGLDIGDYLYKTDSPLTMIRIAHNDKIFNRYFEVIE